MNTLHYSPGACSLAPHILLEEIGHPFTLKLVSSSDGSTRRPEYLKLNPKGRVPVLTCKDFALTEAPAILLHLAMSNPQAGLLSSEPDGLARSILRPGPDLKNLLQRADTTRQRNKAVRQFGHQGFSLVHGLGDMKLGQPLVLDLFAFERFGYHPHGPPAKLQHRIGHQTHDAHTGTAIDQAQVPSPESPMPWPAPVHRQHRPLADRGWSRNKRKCFSWCVLKSVLIKPHQTLPAGRHADNFRGLIRFAYRLAWSGLTRLGDRMLNAGPDDGLCHDDIHAIERGSR